MIQGRYSNPITALQAVISVRSHHFFKLTQTHTKNMNSARSRWMNTHKNLYFYNNLELLSVLYHFKLILNQQSSVFVIGLLASELNPPLSRDESPEQRRPHLVLFSRPWRQRDLLAAGWPLLISWLTYQHPSHVISLLHIIKLLWFGSAGDKTMPNIIRAS